MGANEDMHRQICRSWSRLRADRVLSAVRKSICLELENMLKSELIDRPTRDQSTLPDYHYN